MAIRPPSRAALEQINRERQRLRQEAERKTAREQEKARIREESRTAVELRSQGLTYQQIAGRLGVGLSTAYDRVGRGSFSE
jgi:DNA-directed RNA polymerase specialized sigma24 family protein